MIVSLFIFKHCGQPLELYLKELPIFRPFKPRIDRALCQTPRKRCFQACDCISIISSASTENPESESILSQLEPSSAIAPTRATLGIIAGLKMAEDAVTERASVDAFVESRSADRLCSASSVSLHMSLSRSPSCLPLIHTTFGVFCVLEPCLGLSPVDVLQSIADDCSRRLWSCFRPQYRVQGFAEA